jgi:putative lipoprotein
MAVRPTRSHIVCALAIVLTFAMIAFAPRRARAADDLFGRDKALHFAASAGIALGGYGGTALLTEQRSPRLVVGGSLALLAGIAKEISDRYTGGDPSWRDLGWDVIGTATGVTLAYTIDWGIRRWWR